MIHSALLHVYPIIIKQNNTIQIWERKGFDFPTNEEKTRYTQLKEERQQIQERINQHDKQLLKNERQSKQTKHSMLGRQQQHTLKNAPDVIYARKPIIYIGPKPKNRKTKILEYVDHIRIKPDTQDTPIEIRSFEAHKICTITHTTNKNDPLCA